jgi:CheY-like chemotaxis protein
MDDYLIGFVLMLRDRTAQIKMERNLIQIEKLNSLGNLVAGFAHELNNPLTSVIGFAQLLMTTRQDHEYQEEIGIIHTHALRCKKIVDNLLTFARKHVPEKKRVNVNGVVRSTLDLLNYQLDRSEIEMVPSLTPKLPRVWADASQLQQVLVNLIENARYELKGQRGKRCMSISTGQSDDWIVIKLFNNGPGISEETRGKIFDPFFTTKPPGEGTGLGLSLSYGIIQEHEGTLGVKNRPEGGVEFIIKLPWSEDSEYERRKESGWDQREMREYPYAGKRILVVSEEEEICESMADSLAKLAVEMEAAREGNEAIQKLSTSNFDLLLLDIRLSELNGISLNKRILEQWPAYRNRILFLTGETVDAQGDDSFLAGWDQSRVITNPFNLHILTAKLAACLREPIGSPTEG